MEYVKAPTTRITIINPNNNNNSSRNHRKKKRRTTATNNTRQPLPLTSPNQSNPSSILRDSHITEQTSLKNPFGWTKKWTKWFSSCGTERLPHSTLNPISVSFLISQLILLHYTVIVSKNNNILRCKPIWNVSTS